MFEKKLLEFAVRQSMLRCFVLLALCSAKVVLAGPDNVDFPDLQVHGMLDLRYMHPDGPPSWTDGGLSKLSYGNGRDANLFDLNQGALVLQSRLAWSWLASVTAKYSPRQDTPIDLSEAVLHFLPVSTSHWRFNARFGMFFPPVSLENTGVAWTSPYTLNYSAINSWVGEELKVFGGEGQVSYQRNNGDKITLFASGFGNNDTAGALLAWRGWSLDDYTATLNTAYSLPLQTGIPQFFPKQSSVTRPFVEVDNRPGFYGGFSLERPGMGKFRAMVYDNRGNPAVVRNGQYAWHTRFASAGLKLALPLDMDLIGQGMFGRTQMGAEIGGLFAVDTTFWAGSVLVSKKFGQHRFSVRYDRFGAAGNDYLPQDANGESGDAWTCNYNFTFMSRHQFNLEMSAVSSNRASRSALQQSTIQNQTVWQAAYRLFF